MVKLRTLGLPLKLGRRVLLNDSDGCSYSPDFNFYECCAEHDFYYRNDVGVSRFEADVQLLLCIAEKNSEKLAVWYFLNVRMFGGKFYNPKSLKKKNG